jgi:hypothetical protein
MENQQDDLTPDHPDRKPFPAHWRNSDLISPELLVNTSFWSSPESWPHDPPGFRFLARTAHDFGSAILGHHWTGKEWTLPLIIGPI